MDSCGRRLYLIPTSRKTFCCVDMKADGGKLWRDTNPPIVAKTGPNRTHDQLNNTFVKCRIRSIKAVCCRCFSAALVAVLMLSKGD